MGFFDFRFRKSFGNNNQFHVNENSVGYTKGNVTVNSNGDTTVRTGVKGVTLRNGKISVRKSKRVGNTRVNVSKSGISASRKIGPFNFNTKNGLTFNKGGFVFKFFK